MILLISLFFIAIKSKEHILSTTFNVKSNDIPYTKKYPSFGKVNFYAEYLGTVARKLPELKGEGILPQDRIPTFDSHKDLTDDEKDLCDQESNQLITSTTTGISGTYDAIDKEGYLYSKGKRVANNRKLYKHYGAVGMYLGDVSDDEPAIIKKMIFVPRGYGYSLTGLYAPPGEIITIRISRKDLLTRGQIKITIGQILQNDQPNNIWKAKEYVRMPVLPTTFILTKDTVTAERDGTDYLFYIGSFLGGPIYVKTDGTATFTLTISGAVRYAHFILGYTSPEEFADNWKSTAPYLDTEVWERGILHGGPRKGITTTSYEDFYESMIYWEKVSSVSNQFPASSSDKYGISMLYEAFIAAGGAVSFVGRSTTNCPTYWFNYVVNPTGLVTAQGDTWGPHHEYNHQFQNGWGFNGDGEVSNNVVTLTSYSYFTKISSARTLENDRNDNNWERYTSGSMALNRILKDKPNEPNQLIYHACLLHCFGQVLFIKAAQKRYGRELDDYNHRAWTEVTELDMTYYLDKLSHRNLSQSLNQFKDKHYKYFVPVASIYQTGIGIMVKGSRNAIHTMQPFRIPIGKKYTLDFTDSNSSLIVPPDFEWTIKSITQPEHGQLTKVSDKIYEYTPDPNEIYSGQFNLTIGLKHKTDSSIVADDVELYLELQQSCDFRETFKNVRKIDRKVIWFEEGTDTKDVVSLFESNYEGATNIIDEINTVTTQNSNTEIWDFGSQPNKVTELRGKIEIRPGKYRIALRGRLYCALFLSFDEGETYQKAAYLYNPSNDAVFHLENNESYYDFTIDQKQWVYFKSVLSHFAQGKEPYIGLGFGQFNMNDEVQVKYLNAYEQSYIPDPPFVSEDIYRRSYNQTYLKEYEELGTLVECSYDKWDNNFNITNIFDDNDMNLIHTSFTNPVSADNPFMILVDIGKEILTNTMTIYAAPNFEYQPKSYKLLGGRTNDDLKVLLDVNSAPQNSDRSANTVLNFDLAYIRYYKLIITETYSSKYNLVAFRYIKFGDGFTSPMIPIDDERISLFNSWEREQKLCTFGHLWKGNGNADSPAKGRFVFTGSQIAVNAFYGKGFGSFDVYIDGEKRGTINLDIQKSSERVELCYVSSILTDGEHVFEFQGSGPFNIDSLFFRKPTELNIVDDGDDFVDDVVESSTEDDFIEPEEPVITEDVEKPEDPVQTEKVEIPKDSDISSASDDIGENDNGNSNNNNKGNKDKKSQTILIVGVVIGLIVAGALSAVVTTLLLRKKREASSDALMD